MPEKAALEEKVVQEALPPEAGAQVEVDQARAQERVLQRMRRVRPEGHRARGAVTTHLSSNLVEA